MPIKTCRKVTFAEKEGRKKFNPTADFPPQGCYFFSIPDEKQEGLEDGAIYLFRYGPARDTGKTDRRGKKIFVRRAIPLVKMPFDNEEDANEFCKSIKHLITKGQL